ncbi:MAG: NADAR family protein [Isosphaeraceae bacterium]|nr:NADAR family protein [Isosphaeraceae bacterium]
MRTILKAGTLILVPENEAEAAELDAWKQDQTGHVFLVARNDGSGLTLRDLGAHEEACREPINVTSMSPDPQIKLISNFAPTPFELDGQSYASVEAFWQGLKFDGLERREVARLAGGTARQKGETKGYGPTVRYQGESIPVGTWAHWALMERACRAKFTQNADAQSALLATGTRPLTHRVRHDSRTIPGTIMAEIWMKLRAQLRPC